MTFAGSVSQLITQAKGGDEEAFAALHHRYWPQIVALAGSRLNRVPPMAADADDVAQRAFMDLHLNFRESRVPKLTTRHQFLALLSHIVLRRVLNEVRHETAQRRGGIDTRTFSGVSLEMIVDTATGPEQKAILHDCYEFYLRSVPESLRLLAELHLAGVTNREIASQMNCVERTVERKLALLRRGWQELAGSSLGRDFEDLD